MDISIFIPVYKESNQIAGALKELGSQNVSKEIFVTVDQPTEGFLETLKDLETRKSGRKVYR